MSECNIKLRHEGKAYPRTCAKCKLGPCQDGQDYAGLTARIRELENENTRLRAEVEAVLQKAAGIVNWFDGNEATSEEVASAVMALSSAGGRAALAEQKADVWRRAIEAAADIVKNTPEWKFGNLWHRRDIETNVRAIPMPADLGGTDE